MSPRGAGVLGGEVRVRAHSAPGGRVQIRTRGTLLLLVA